MCEWAGIRKFTPPRHRSKLRFDKGLNDLRDKRLLTFDQGQLTRIDLAEGKTNIEFGKNAQNEWAIVAAAAVPRRQLPGGRTPAQAQRFENGFDRAAQPTRKKRSTVSHRANRLLPLKLD